MGKLSEVKESFGENSKKMLDLRIFGVEPADV
jgi:hypothetical protein